MKWTTKQIEQLKRLYPGVDNKSLSVFLGRSITSIINKASELGISKEPIQKQKPVKLLNLHHGDSLQYHYMRQFYTIQGFKTIVEAHNHYSQNRKYYGKEMFEKAYKKWFNTLKIAV